MKHKPTITIGIPAYNEEQNIKNILTDLLSQNVNDLNIESIIVLSDNSNDKTVDIVKKISSKKIALKHFETRKGKGEIINTFFNNATADIAIIMDADIRIFDKNHIQKLTSPILKGDFDLTSADAFHINTKSLPEKVISSSMYWKKSIYKKLSKGNNIYTCYGYSRAFSKKLYKLIKFPESVGEDAYSYLFTIHNGMKFKAVNNTRVYYKLPANFKDHSKQSIRFFHSKKRFVKEFGTKEVRNAYRLPRTNTIMSLLTFSKTNPYILAYIIVVILMKLKSQLIEPTKNTWSIAETSKKGIL